MPGRMPLFPLLALAVSAAIALAGCGSNGPDKSRLLSRSAASNLRSTLNEVERLVQEGQCDQAKAQATAFQHQVGSMRRLDPTLRDALETGAARLQTLVGDGCAPAPAVGSTGATGPVEPQPQNTKPQKKAKNPGKGKGNGQGKQNGGNGGDQSGGVQISPGQSPGGGD